ncbi:MAG: Ig-like domain-containing protein [Micrococcales bacterium]|nr:Ig-like domain-containing protein [Micrococcales bacterium]
MKNKAVRVQLSALLVVGLGVVCAPMGGAIPPASPTSGPAGGGTVVSGEIPPGFTAVDGGDTTGYALDREGRVWTWGYNTYGQLGHATPTNPSPPVRLKAGAWTLPEFTAIAAGYAAGYALEENGRIWAWGYNNYGQLGNGNDTNSSAPVPMQATPGPLPKFTAIAAGPATGYALDEGGDIWAWGRNNFGQLGDGTNVPHSLSPVRVRAASGVLPVFTAIAAGGLSSYALDKQGEVWAWGYNSNGQLGDGTTTDSRTPVRLHAASGTLPEFTAIAAGGYTAYALDKAGGVWAWGNNSDGQLGDGTTTDSKTPVRVWNPTGVRFAAIGSGAAAGYALDDTGAVWAWGRNDNGQLGNGTSTPSLTPVRVSSGTLPKFTAIGQGADTGYALGERGDLWAWGSNYYGQLGTGTTTDSTTPLLLSAAIGRVTFGGISGTSLSSSGSAWSVVTPAGCGQAPVVVSYGFRSATEESTSAGVFAHGQPPAITSQPTSGQILVGEEFTATVGVSGDPVPSVHWQSRVGEGSWADVPGANALTLTTWPTVSTEYRAVATNCWSYLNASAFTAYSTVASVTVPTPSPTPTTPCPRPTRSKHSPSPSSSSPSPSSSSPAPSSPASSSPSPSTGPSLPGPAVSPSLPPNAGKVSAVAMAMKKVTMKKNTTLKAVAMAYPAGVKTKLSWSSSKPKVAKVSAAGKIRAIKPGRAVITARAENGTVARLKVTVISQAVKAAKVKVTLKGTGIKPSKSGKITVKTGTSTRLTVQPTPSRATLKKMPTYLSSKPKVASVDKTGLVTAKKKGQAKITVTLAGKKTTVRLNIR